MKRKVLFAFLLVAVVMIFTGCEFYASLALYNEFIVDWMVDVDDQTVYVDASDSVVYVDVPVGIAGKTVWVDTYYYGTSGYIFFASYSAWMDPGSDYYLYLGYY
ncbi:MAG: hypothetical protein JW874_06975 [Spirochaetales bacterium]|nr:hypothetical protein [Spirochaetales bacterium]